MKNGYEAVNLHSTASTVIPVPMIGGNGNWFVGNEDTGVNAHGLKGETGAAGIQGPKGETGPQGAKGETPELADNLTTTIPGMALDATMGKALGDKIAANTDSIVQLSGQCRQHTYTDIEQIGLTTAATLADICAVLPSGSEITLRVGQTPFYEAPTSWGIMKVTRIGDNFQAVHIPFQRNLWGRMYIKSGSLSESSGWFQVQTTSLNA